MSIVLSPDVEKQIEEMVNSGRFSSGEEAVRCCIAIFQMYEKEQKERLEEMQQHGEDVRRLVDEGRAAIERGEVELYNSVTLREMIEEIKSEGRQRRRLQAAS